MIINRRLGAAVAALFAIGSHSANAEVTLQHPADLQVLVVDGRLHDAPSITASPARLRLEDGPHQLLVRLGAELRVQGNEREYSYSDTFVLRFDASDEALQLGVPPVTNRRQMAQFNAAPGWRLRDANGSPVPLAHAPLRKEGFQLSRDYLSELEAFNRSGAAAALPRLQSAATAAAEATPARAASGTSTPAALALPMLKYWYQQADPVTRRQFIQWIESSNKRE